MAFNDKLKELRLKAKMTQEELGSKLFVTRQAISKWENGSSNPDLKTIDEIAKLFNTTREELLGEAPKKSKRSNGFLIAFISSAITAVIAFALMLIILNLNSSTISNGEVEKEENPLIYCSLDEELILENPNELQAVDIPFYSLYEINNELPGCRYFNMGYDDKAGRSFIYLIIPGGFYENIYLYRMIKNDSKYEVSKLKLDIIENNGDEVLWTKFNYFDIYIKEINPLEKVEIRAFNSNMELISLDEISLDSNGRLINEKLEPCLSLNNGYYQVNLTKCYTIRCYDYLGNVKDYLIEESSNILLYLKLNDKRLNRFNYYIKFII